MSSMPPSPELPFSRPLTVAELPAKGRDIRLTATEAELAALAPVLLVPAVTSLEADLLVRRFGRDGVAVEGQVKARLSQVSVVSGETFEQDVEAPVDIKFSPDGIDPNAPVALEDLIGEAEDPPDRLIDGRIDLGAIAVEFLALELDPYPRKPGEAFEAPGHDAAPPSPFADLVKLKKTD